MFSSTAIIFLWVPIAVWAWLSASILLAGAAVRRELDEIHALRMGAIEDGRNPYKYPYPPEESTFPRTMWRVFFLLPYGDILPYSTRSKP